MERPESVGELTETLRQGGYLADRGLATALFVALSLNRPILLEGEVGVGQDRGGQGHGLGLRPQADPAAVLRGHRHQPGAVRVGLRPPDAAHPGAVRAPGRRLRRGRQAVRPEVPAGAAAAGSGPGRRSGRAADRRDRPGRRRVRGLPARGALRLPDQHPRDRHGQGGQPAAGGAHLQPHPGAARRAEAALPVPLDRLPGRRTRGRDRPDPGARHLGGAGPQGGRRRPAASRARPGQAAGSGRDHRLGPHPGFPRRVGPGRNAQDTLGAVVKDRDDLEVVLDNLQEITSGARGS